jgi:hypothetical protein
MTAPGPRRSPARIVAFVALLLTVIVCAGFVYAAVK